LRPFPERKFFSGQETVPRILAKLQLPAADEDHRRVLAVLMFLDAH